jgi:flagellin-like hook-associated protein FlgL
MSIHVRPTQASMTQQIQSHLARQLRELVRVQEQIATGKRIQRPSDDPPAATRAASLQRQLAALERHAKAAQSARGTLDAGAAALQDGGDLLAEARALLVQGLNGTLNAQDRATLAKDVRALRSQLLDLANSPAGEGYLFGGTHAGSAPFQEWSVAGHAKVKYVGTSQVPQLQIGAQTTLAAGLDGPSAFGPLGPGAAQLTSSTGLQLGASAAHGAGFEHLLLRHDATVGALSNGLALANGGSQDTFLGSRTLTIDAAAGTVRFGSGPARAVPLAGAPDFANFVVQDEHGAEVHLDFTAWTGGSSSDALTGAGSISIDGTTFQSLDFLQTDLQIVHEQTGTVVHVDTTGVHTAGTELLTFSGSASVFDVLQGAADDLDNLDELAPDDLHERLSVWLDELDAGSERVLAGVATLGARSATAEAAVERTERTNLWVQSTLSQAEDVDFSRAALELARAEQALQVTQATSVRLLQHSLLSFLR